jgi:copper resistance protein D
MIPLFLLWLRVAGLAGQAIALGGALLAVVVLRRTREGRSADGIRLALTLAGSGALLAVAAQLGALATLASLFAGNSDTSLATLLASTPGQVGLLRIGVALAGAALCLRRAPASRGAGALLLAVMILLSLTGAFASHAMGRTEGRAWLLAVSAVHQAAAAAWVGGLACAVVLVIRRPDGEPITWLRPFSALAAGAVALLALTGAALSLEYVATPAAAIGTSYGTMVLAKLVLFAAMLVMGVMNHRALHRAGDSASSPLLLSRRLEVEAGLAVVMLFVAASIASAPPAADVKSADLVSADEIRTVLAPRWPRLATPSLAELVAGTALGDKNAPRTDVDRAWSEFGHHVAGLFVIAMGVLAMLERSGGAPWARHWPLLIIALAGFVAWSVDPEGWQTGAVGFREQFFDPEVVQHRLMLLLTGVFGLAQWWVHTGRRPHSVLRYVFPVAGVAGGLLLLSHVHEVNNPKSAFFMELTHMQLGLMSLLVGWARWLELRLPPVEGRGPGRLWAPALVAFGLLLVLYREA